MGNLEEPQPTEGMAEAEAPMEAQPTGEEDQQPLTEATVVE